MNNKTLGKQILSQDGFIVTIFKGEFYEVKVIENKAKHIKEVGFTRIKETRFIPDVYVSMFDGIAVKVGTTSFGSLEVDEFEEYVELMVKVTEEIQMMKKEIVDMFK